jgi:hypothetical protein
LEWIAKL